MATNISETEFAETKKRSDEWIKSFCSGLERMKAETIGYRCDTEKHSLIYDLIASKTAKTIMRISFREIQDAGGKSRLLNNEEFTVSLDVRDSFWDEPARLLLSKSFKESLRTSFKNKNIDIRYHMV
jgi:hypothetical protein